jgi:hypothetical protein
MLDCPIKAAAAPGAATGRAQARKLDRTYAPTVSSVDNPGTARRRRYRLRLKSGAAVITVPVADLNGLIGLLLDSDALDLGQSEDRRAIGEALGRLMDATVRNVSTRAQT